MDEIESLMHRLGITFAAGLTQPGSMRASLTAYGHRSQAYDVAGDAAAIGRWTATAGADPHALMQELRSAVGVDGPFAVELTASPAGDYAVTYHAVGAGPLGEPSIVLDAGYRFPDHPGPGLVRPARPDGRPTDAAVLADMQSLVAQFIAQHTRLRGAAPRFGPGYPEEAILAAEHQLGVRLPEDLRALYRVIHDDDGESGLLGRFCPAPLERVVTWHHQNVGSPAVDDLFEHTPVVFESYPPGRVRRLSRSDRWVTFAPDYGMNYAAVDLDPAGAGEFGQILMIGRDVLGPAVHVAPSVRHLLRTVVAALQATASDEEDDWEPPNPPPHTWHVDVGDADLAGLVAAVPDPSVLQLVHLHQAGRVRLPDLAGLAQLRVIRVVDGRQRAGQVDLSIPPGPPVEQIDVTARQFDPARLAGASTLRYVTLAGNTAPVQVAALAALPDLVRLDLSGAIVTDVSAVATFPALRVLVLDAAQWRALLDTGWTPERLAAVRLGGRESVRHAAAWHSAIRGTDRVAPPHRTIRGPR